MVSDVGGGGESRRDILKEDPRDVPRRPEGRVRAGQAGGGGHGSGPGKPEDGHPWGGWEQGARGIFRGQHLLLRAQPDFPLRKSLVAAMWCTHKRRQGDSRETRETW